MNTEDKGLTATGKPRKRRAGGGRTSKYGVATRSIRVPETITTEQIMAIQDLQTILDHWEGQCASNPDSARHYFLRQALDEIRALGY
jgi:hypothetical protein